MERLRTRALPDLFRRLPSQSLEARHPLGAEPLAVDPYAGASTRRRLHRARQEVLDRQKQSPVILEQELLIGACELHFELGFALQHLNLEIEPRERRELSRGRGSELGGRAFGRRQIASLGYEIHGNRVDRTALAALARTAATATPTTSAPLLALATTAARFLPITARCAAGRCPAALRPAAWCAAARCRATRRSLSTEAAALVALTALIALAALSRLSALSGLGALTALITAMATIAAMPAPAMALARRSRGTQVDRHRWRIAVQVEVLLGLELRGVVDLLRGSRRLLVAGGLPAHRALGIDLDHHVAPLAQESIAPLDALVVEGVGLDAVVLGGDQDRLLERGAGEELAGWFTHCFLARGARSFFPAGAPIDGTVSSPPMYPAFFKR